MGDLMKVTITILATVTAMVMIGFGLYGFTQNLQMWGAPIVGGMIVGALSMIAAYTEY
jgi:hypothetical protein